MACAASHLDASEVRPLHPDTVVHARLARSHSEAFYIDRAGPVTARRCCGPCSVFCRNFTPPLLSVIAT